MSEKPRNLEFHHVPHGEHNFEYEPIGELADIFKNGDYVKVETIKNYVQQIVEQVNRSTDPNAQKACVMDLLRENNIRNLLVQIKVDENDIDEVEKMTIYWVKEIKKRIVEELKKYLPEDIYFFVTEKHKEQMGHFNKKSTLIDTGTNKEYFLKEGTTDLETKKNREKCLKKLRNALANLKNPDEEMPFIIAPKDIGQSTQDNQADKKTLSYTSQKADLTLVENILLDKIDEDKFEYDIELAENGARQVLNGILDCLKGAKFLAENNLTLTDLNTEPIGKNFGINNKNNKGCFFDLDGLLEVDSNIHRIVGPSESDGKPMVDLFAPEYRTFFNQTASRATTQSMIWEIGNSLYRLADIQTMIIFATPNFFNKTKMMFVWEKIKNFSEKMTAENPTDRPSFDNCITKLEEIINKLSDKK